MAADDRAVIAPFPYKDADRIVAFSVHNLENSRGGRSYFQPAEFLEYQNQSYVFEEVIGGGNDDILLTTPVGTEQFDGAYVTPNTFDFLGVPALVVGKGGLKAKPSEPDAGSRTSSRWGSIEAAGCTMEHLALKLSEVLVIDHAEKPSEN